MKNIYLDLTLHKFLLEIKVKKQSPIFVIDIEIYDYLEAITNNFNIDRIKFTILTIYQEYYKELKKLYLKKGWKIPYKRDTCEYNKSCLFMQKVRIYCYTDMEQVVLNMKEDRELSYPCLALRRLIDFLIEKLPEEVRIKYERINEYLKIEPTQETSKVFKQNKHFVRSFSVDEQKLNTILQPYLPALEQSGCITQNPLKWLKSKSLLAYFVDVANDKLNLKHGEKRKIKPFETMFNITGLSGAINEYKNKTGQKPIDSEIIDNIF